MIRRASCPRCRGNLFLDRSDGPAVWSCLQCGRSFAPPPAAAVAGGQEERAA